MIRFNLSSRARKDEDTKAIARENLKAKISEQFGLGSDPDAVLIVGGFKKSKGNKRKNGVKKGMQGDSECVKFLKKRFDANYFVVREMEKLRTHDREKFMNAFNDLIMAKNKLQEIVSCLIKLDFPVSYFQNGKSTRIYLGLDKIIENTLTNLTNFLHLCKIADTEKKALHDLDNKHMIILDSVKRIMEYLITIRDFPFFAKHPKIDKRYESNNPGAAIDKYIMLLTLVYEKANINDVLSFEKDGKTYEINGSNILVGHVKEMFERILCK